MKSLKKFSVEFICNLFGFLFVDESKITHLDDTNPILSLPSELEIKMQWGDLTNALEKNSAYLEAVKNLEVEPLLELGFKPNEDYLASIVLSHQMMRSLIRDYSYPSNYVLN